MIKINKILILSMLFHIYACGQANKVKKKQVSLNSIYSLAIGDFIKSANKKNLTTFDTLYIAKRQTGQADDFPEITLPEKIENTEIILISPELAVKSQEEIKSRIYINLIGWVDQKKAEFILVVFSNGFEHLYDCSLIYKYSEVKESFQLKKMQFKEPPFD